MFLILLDAAVLMFLMQAINQDDVGLGAAFVTALVTSIGAGLLTLFLVSAMGALGAILAAVIVAVALSVAISFFFGAEIKRAGLIAVLFMVAHIGMAMGLRAMFS